MTIYFWLSYVVLWVIVFVMLVVNLVLFRQLGIMVMGTARGINDSGIPVNRKLPFVVSKTVDGRSWNTDAIKGKPHLLFFGSPNCAECIKILPELERVANLFGVTPILLLFAELEQAQTYIQKNKIKFDTVQATTTVGQELDISATPFAYGLDASGVVRAKGLINTREQLESMAQAALAV